MHLIIECIDTFMTIMNLIRLVTRSLPTFICCNLFFSPFLYGQITYNYAGLNSTTISSEYLDREMIQETVDENEGWLGSWRENDWYYFDFAQEIDLSSVEFAFYENTCFENCKLEFNLITRDSTIEIEISDTVSTHAVGLKTNYLIVERKEVSPRGPGHINEIRILSTTAPRNSSHGLPRIKLNKKFRLRIKNQLSQLTETEIKQEKKKWKKKKKFYKQKIRNKLSPSEQDFFTDRIFYGNDEKWHCYKIQNYIHQLDNESLTELYDDCGCDVRDDFFARRMMATEAMKQRTFHFLGNELSYLSDTTENVLLRYIEGGEAWAGHAVTHLCLMNKIEHLDKIEALRYDSNVYTQVQALNGLLYFGESKKALQIAKTIYERETISLSQDSISIYGYYAKAALTIMNNYYPNETLPLLLNLYKRYRHLYPKEMKLHEHWTNAYHYGSKYGKRVESFQGCDQSILVYIETYLRQHPHLINYPVLKEFKKSIDERAASAKEDLDF